MKKQLTHYILLLIIGSIFISCEKPPEEEDPRILQEDKDLVLDNRGGLAAALWNTYCYAKQIYLWNEALPPIKEFNPKQYAEGVEVNHKKAFQNLLNAIVKYSNGQDRWSNIKAWGTLLASVPRGNEISLDKIPKLGFAYIIAPASSQAYVTMVFPGSPAEKVGLKRGDTIVAYQPTNLGTYAVSIIKNKIAKIVSIDEDVNYQIPPDVIAKVVSVESKTDKTKKDVGYLLFNSFNSNLYYVNALSSAFRMFKEANISELVLDLRYNTGGENIMIDYLVNLIAPPELEGKNLRGYQYNTTVSSGSALFLKEQSNRVFQEVYDQAQRKIVIKRNFNSLYGVRNIYIIVSSKTVSASEALITSLKYYANKGYVGLQLIGKQTAGKGVGSFEINVNGFTVTLMSFRNTDATTGTISPDGISPDYNCDDDLKHELGDIHEACFATAINHIESRPGGWGWKPSTNPDNNPPIKPNDNN